MVIYLLITGTALPSSNNDVSITGQHQASLGPARKPLIQLGLVDALHLACDFATLQHWEFQSSNQSLVDYLIFI